MNHSKRPSPLRWFPFCSFGKNERGVAAIEFALIFPLMIVVYAGMVDVTHAYMAKRKLTMAVGSAGDILARYSTVTNSDLDQIIDAARSTIAPMNVSDFKITLSLLRLNGQNATVICSYGDQPLTIGANEPIATGLGTLSSNGLLQDLIYATGTFKSYSILSNLITFQPSFTFSEKAHFLPRINDTVGWASGCNTAPGGSGGGTGVSSVGGTTDSDGNNSAPCVSGTSGNDPKGLCPDPNLNGGGGTTDPGNNPKDPGAGGGVGGVDPANGGKS